jgi:DtxR family Mn-dependent transcriptional regulator
MTADALLSPNMEHYLKAIFEVVREKHAAKPRDIAHRLDVKQSSVTSAMRWLSEHGFIHYKPFDLITLTDAGETVARSIIRRNEVLCNFFTKVLAVDPVEAERAACAMEHGVSCEIIERFTRFAEFIEVCPRGGARWIRGMAHSCNGGILLDECEHCISECLADVVVRRKHNEKEPVMTLPLHELPPGSQGRISKQTASDTLTTRIAEMGVTPGAVVEVEKVAPLGDPIQIKVRGYHLSLRKDEAATILVEPIPPQD